MTETERGFATIVHNEHALETKRRKRALRSFRRDDRLEGLIEFRQSEPDAFAKLPALEKLAVDHYATARKAAHDAAMAEEDDAA